MARVPLDASYGVQRAIEELNDEMLRLKAQLATAAKELKNATLPVESLQKDVAFLKQLRRIPSRGMRILATEMPLFLSDTLDWDSPMSNAPVTSVSADYAVLPGDFVILVDCSSGDKTITFPLASVKKGRIFQVKKIDPSANKVILAASGADLIDGAALQYLLTQYEAAPFVSDGTTHWRVL